MMTSKKILVTGSRGFIGKHLMTKFGDNWFEWDLKLNRDIFDSKFEDIMKNTSIVIHLAALTDVKGSFGREKEYFKTNVLGTARILDLAIKYKVKVIFTSTGAYYIPDSSPYAKSKKMADDLCQEVMKFHPVTILRFFNIYGKNMNPFSGSIIYQFLEGSKQGEILVYGNGESKRDFISVEDIIRIIKRATLTPWTGKIIDIGSGQVFSLKELAEIFAKHTNARIFFDTSKKEIQWSFPNIENLKKLYLIPLRTNLEEDIKELIKYYAKD